MWWCNKRRSHCWIRRSLIKKICFPIALLIFLIGCVPAELNHPIDTPQNTKAHANSKPKFKIEETYEKFSGKKLYPKATIVIGKDRSQILSIFGNPSFKRNDLGVALWQYRIQNCVLDIIFYPIENRSKFLVTHLEARNKKGGKLSIQACVSQLFWTKEERSESQS